MRIAIIGHKKIEVGLGALLDRVVPSHQGFASMATDGLPLLQLPTKLSVNQLFAPLQKPITMKHTTRIDKVDGTVVFLRNNTKWNVSSADATKVSMWSKFADIETEDFGFIERGLTNLETNVFIKAEKL